MYNSTAKSFFLKNIKSGNIKKIKIFGSSMLPTFSSGDEIEITSEIELKVGNIVAAVNNRANNFVVHRIIDINFKNKQVCLLGDNEKETNKRWIPFSAIFAQAKEPKRENIKNLHFNLVCDIPFNKPKYFNEPTYQVFQAVKTQDDDTYYFDFNIQFNRKIYNKTKIEEFKNCNGDKTKFKNFYNYMDLARIIATKKFNIFRFTYGELVLCNPTESNDIINVINNYKTTIYYPFYKEKIFELKKLIKLKNTLKKPIKIYVVVNNFNKLLSAIIFAKICSEILYIKPILINKSPIFYGKFNTEYYEQFFAEIIPIARINKNINYLNTEYSQINFEEYITPYKVAPITIREECYYKNCLFCDRHCKDNFSFHTNNIVEKIANLQKLGVNNIVFEDDCIIPYEIEEILDVLKEKNISIKWQGTFRFDKSLNDENKIKRFRENGCKFLFFGMETFSANLLKKMNKGIEIEDAINILKFCKKYSINTCISLMFNFPGETLNDIHQTFESIKKYIDLIDQFEINFFTPTKNCKICDNLNGVNYLGYSSPISKQKQNVLLQIQNYLKDRNKLDSSYLKNYLCWR